MKKLFLILFSFTALAAIVPNIIGRGLPEVFTAEVLAHYDAAPEDVYQLLSDFERLPAAGDMAKSVRELEPDGTGLARWEEDLGSSVVTVRTLEATASERLVREMQDSVVPMTARWEFVLEPDAGGTLVRLANRTEVRDGTWHVPYFRFALDKLNAVEKGPRGLLERLGSVLGAPADFR